MDFSDLSCCKSLCLSWLWRSECRVQYPWVFSVLSGVTLDSTETPPLAKTPFSWLLTKPLVFLLFLSYFGPWFLWARGFSWEKPHIIYYLRIQSSSSTEEIGHPSLLQCFVFQTHRPLSDGRASAHSTHFVLSAPDVLPLVARQSEQLPCRSAEVNFFSVFSLPRMSWNLAWTFGEIFRATFSRIWVCDGKFYQNFTSKTVWKTENFTQISLCWGAALTARNAKLSTTTAREQNRALGAQVYGRYPNPGKHRKSISTIAFAGSAKIWAPRWW